MADVSKYVRQQDNGIFQYYRRVPVELSGIDRRKFVKHSLKTKDHREALERASTIHLAVEVMWKSMAAGAGKRDWGQYASAVELAQSHGFTYRSAGDVAASALEEFDARIAAAEKHRPAAPAIVGLIDRPEPKISDIWDLYESNFKAGLTGMSPGQLNKHKISRLRAIKYLQDILGNIKLSEIRRDDVLRFRDWWTNKVSAERLRAYSANRSFSDIAGMISVIDDALRTSYHDAWEKIRIKETNATKLRRRPPFSPEWVQKRLLAPGALDTMNLDARLIVYTIIETGMRLTEACNLRPQDIRLDDEVPHVEVAERDDRRQKTDHSVRRIPLVGVSLWAMRQAPQGFKRYHDKSDSASALINKVLDSHHLRPTERHTLYSLRHTFQDRIENAGASDRMQADLMGHEFGRPEYGDGPVMKLRQQFLEGIKFEWNVPEILHGDQP